MRRRRSVEPPGRRRRQGKTAKLSQEELAQRMGTSQSTIARLESGAAKPSLSTLERFAKATGTRVRVSLVPAAPRKKKTRKAA